MSRLRSASLLAALSLCALGIPAGAHAAGAAVARDVGCIGITVWADADEARSAR